MIPTMKEEWIEQLRQKMADYQEPAPEVSWEEIEKAVAANRQKAKRIAIWPRRIAAAVLVMVAGGAGYYLLNRQEPEISQQTASVVVEKKGYEASDHSPFASVKQHIQKEKTIIVAQAEEVQIVEQAPETETTEVPEEQKTEAPEEQKPETQTQPSGKSDKGQVPVNPVRQDFPDRYLTPVRTNKKARLMAKAYLGNGFTGNNGVNDWNTKDFAYSSSTNPGNKQYEDLIQSENGVTEETGTSPSTSIDYPTTPTDENPVEKPIEPIEMQESVNHHQPIRFGLSLRYVINERWSIDAGLSYTLLTSDITLTAGSKQVDLKQRLNYIGIPINVNYQLWNYRHFNVYASAGGVVEKMVKGKQGDESVSIAPLQVSLNAGLGAEYEFVDWLSIYAEPGLAYYFDNGSRVQTFYQDKPLNFNLNLGLRLNIK